MNKYELGAVLGKGTYSEVFAAKRKRGHQDEERKDDDEEEDLVAIKRMTKSKLISPTERDIPRREIQYMELIGRHPHAVFMYESYEDADSVFLVLELAQGMTLEHRLQRNPLGLGNSASRLVVHQLLLAVLHLHTLGIVHMDISPRNVLVDDAMGCKLIDFGLAFHVEDGFECSPAAAADGGGGSYTAPEVETGGVSESADMWSLGILAYEMLSGMWPAQSQQEIAFPDECWLDKDVLAVHFTKSLLVQNPQLRPTISQALESSWFLELK